MYQISYLMGSLQLRSVYQDLVVNTKKMTAKQFNDTVVKTGSMPIEMVRVLVGNKPLTRLPYAVEVLPRRTRRELIQSGPAPPTP